MTAQQLLKTHDPRTVHCADTILTMQYPDAKITRRPIVVEKRIHVGYHYTISRGLLRWETAELYVVQ
jgi:arsenate reductase-like glutaredoxin family protein